MGMLEVNHICKRFGSCEVIRDLSFSVPEHSVFGFIGENGAGKTTTIQMILGLMKPDKGEIRVNGDRVVPGKNRTNQYIGYLPDVPEFYGFMTPREYLTMCGEITGMKKHDIRRRSEELLELVRLQEANRRIQHFSRGMKQRLGIAQALLNSPKLLICDEPTSALDPIGRKEILDILCSVKSHTTVIFSTHILADVERICDRIVLLHDGKAALNGTLEDIRSVRREERVEVEFFDKGDAEKFSAIYETAKYQGGTKVCVPSKHEGDMEKIMMALIANHMKVQRLEKQEPTLEDLFLEVAGK